MARPHGYPLTLTRREAEDFLNNVHGEAAYGSVEAAQAYYRLHGADDWALVAEHFHLREVAIAELVASGIWDMAWVRRYHIAQRYAQRLTEAPPPLLDYLSPGKLKLHLIDGFHRIGAARIRGEHMIWVYMPE